MQLPVALPDLASSLNGLLLLRSVQLALRKVLEGLTLNPHLTQPCTMPGS